MVFDLLGQDKKQILAALGAAALFGVLAYGFAAFSFAPFHDSLWCAYQVSPTHNELNSQIAFGRVLQPAYVTIVGALATTPTTSIAVALIWIALAAFLICKMLDLESTVEVIAVAALCVVNKTIVSLVSTYLPWLSADAFSLLLATMAVFCWRQSCEQRAAWRVVAASICIGVSLGIYQSFICSYIVIVLLVSIKDLLTGISLSFVLKRGLKAALILLGGCGIYILLLAVIPAAMNISLSQGGYNSVTNIGTNGEPLLERFAQTAKEVLRAFFASGEVASVWDPRLIVIVNAVVVVSSLALLAIVVRKRKLRPSEAATALMLACVACFFADATRLVNQVTHDLMHYAFWLLYLLPILLCSQLGEKRDVCNVRSESSSDRYSCIFGGIAKCAVAACLFIVVYNNIQVSNTILVDHAIRYDATYSLLTEVMTRVDDLPGYVEGETKIAFVGTATGHLDAPATPPAAKALLGQNNSGLSFESNDYLRIMIKDLMLRKASIMGVSETETLLRNSSIALMPAWPSLDSVRMVDGVAVVKF